MPSSGQSGQYGLIPQNVFRQKYEVTNIIDPTSADDYFRDTLKDLSCDATFFESDHTRTDTHAEEFLSLRHSGHRSGEVPDAPDLFLELTDRDPRGTALDPNMRTIADQSWERASSYKFYSDSDNSVTEREKRPQQLIQQLRDQFENIKSRMKWFTTSKDSFAAGGNYTQSQLSRTDTIEHQKGLSTRGEIQTAAKTNLTTMMSNNMPLGWEQTSDLEFKVASYGQIRSIATGEDQELIRTNIADEKSANLTTFQDQTVTVGVAQMMKVVVDSIGKREQNGEWLPGLSREQTTTQFKAVDEMSKVDNFVGDQKMSTVFRTVENFIGQLNRQSGMSAQDIEQQLQIITFMDNAIRTAPKSVERAKATDIVLSAKAAEQFASRGVGPGSRTVKNTRQTNETAKRFESMTVAHLGTSRMVNVNSQLSKTVIGEGYKQSSSVRNNIIIKNPELRNAYTAEDGQIHNSFGIADRSGAGLGSKFTRDKMDTDRTLNAISDMN